MKIPKRPRKMRKKPKQLNSQSYSHKWLDLDREVTGAQVFFETNDWELDQNDRQALAKLSVELGRILGGGHRVGLRCEGHTDVRAEDEHNLRLSEKRKNSVQMYLKTSLGSLRGFSVSGKGYGEQKARPASKYWAEDRRVDVMVKVTPSWAGPNPHGKKRAEIFRKYSPVYRLWRERGLDYLIDMYEAYDQQSDPVTIRPQDLEKVLDLIGKLASPSDYRMIQNWAKGARRTAVITEAYGVEYRKAYQEAYRQYEKAQHQKS
jgi:outer membrane protein OmpA-like peptidoglycan-associated protein